MATRKKTPRKTAARKKKATKKKTVSKKKAAAKKTTAGKKKAAKTTTAKKKTGTKKKAGKKAGKKRLKTGDKVSWSSLNGPSTGTVEKKVTRKTRVKSHTVKASPASPQYIVASSKTGKRAAHKAKSLRKRG